MVEEEIASDSELHELWFLRNFRGKIRNPGTNPVLSLKKKIGILIMANTFSALFLLIFWNWRTLSNISVRWIEYLVAKYTSNVGESPVSHPVWLLLFLRDVNISALSGFNGDMGLYGDIRDIEFICRCWVSHRCLTLRVLWLVVEPLALVIALWSIISWTNCSQRKNRNLELSSFHFFPFSYFYLYTDICT